MSLSVIALVLAGVGSIGFLVFRLQSLGDELPLIAVSALCLGALVIVRPAIGLAAIVVCAALVKIEIGTGTNSPIVASLVCAVLLLPGWIAHRTLHRRRLNLLPRWLSVSIWCIIGFTLLSWLWGQVTLDPRVIYPSNFYRVQIAQAALIIVSATLLFVGGDLFRSRRLRNMLMTAIIVVGMIDLLIRQFLPDSSSGLLNVQTFNTFGLFGLWFVALCWSNAVLNDRLSPGVRLVLAGFACGWLVRAILIDGAWVSGWLPAAIAMLAVSFVAGPRVAVPVSLAVAVFITFSFGYFYDLLVTRQVADGSIGGDFGRVELWKRNIEISQDWLPLGSGPAAYALYYMTFIPDQAMSSHSNYIDLLSQIGIGGVLGFVSLLVGLLVLGIRTWPRLSDPTDRTLCAAAVGAIPGVMFSLWFGDWLIPFVYNQTIAGFNHSAYSWLILAALSGLIVQHSGLASDDG